MEKSAVIGGVDHVESVAFKTDATQHTKSVGFTEQEHHLGTFAALRRYKQAVFWALFFGLSVIMW